MDKFDVSFQPVIVEFHLKVSESQESIYYSLCRKLSEHTDLLNQDKPEKTIPVTVTGYYQQRKSSSTISAKEDMKFLAHEQVGLEVPLSSNGNDYYQQGIHSDSTPSKFEQFSYDDSSSIMMGGFEYVDKVIEKEKQLRPNELFGGLSNQSLDNQSLDKYNQSELSFGDINLEQSEEFIPSGFATVNLDQLEGKEDQGYIMYKQNDDDLPTATLTQLNVDSTTCQRNASEMLDEDSYAGSIFSEMSDNQDTKSGNFLNPPCDSDRTEHVQVHDTTLFLNVDKQDSGDLFIPQYMDQSDTSSNYIFSSGLSSSHLPTDKYSPYVSPPL